MRRRITIHWFRRDLRLDDNASLYHALKNHENVLPLFIFDSNILDDLQDKSDARVNFIYNCIKNLHKKLAEPGSSILVKYGKPAEVWKELIATYSVDAVFTNTDYEPYATERDIEIKNLLAEKNIPFFSFKDQVIFEKNEIVKDDGTPYTVFTPYSKKWRSKLDGFYLKSYPTEKYFHHFSQIKTLPLPSLKKIGFEISQLEIPTVEPDENLISQYDKTRNFPGLKGTSRMGIHLRFGTISIRRLAALALRLNETYVNELIWREFYQAILWHFPYVVKHAFKKEFDNIQWRNNENEFRLWCEGKTGYPIVDAGMRELNATGFMHNRVRMVVASFLVKDLLIDWHLGEAYFAEKLLDYELASNNGGWQWAAGTGVDASPFFRIFNPSEQLKKFDPQHIYIKKWLPEYTELNYPLPIVDHAFARQRCLQAFKAVKEKKQ